MYFGSDWTRKKWSAQENSGNSQEKYVYVYYKRYREDSAAAGALQLNRNIVYLWVAFTVYTLVLKFQKMFAQSEFVTVKWLKKVCL